MESFVQTRPVSRKMLIVGWIVSILPVLMLLMSAFMKFAQPKDVVEGFAHLGWDLKMAVGLGVVELACTAIYLFPPTAVLGAMLLTGYLGGAVATHLRAGDPVMNAMTPAILGVVLWLGLFLRYPRLWKLIPLRP